MGDMRKKANRKERKKTYKNITKYKSRWKKRGIIAENKSIKTGVPENKNEFRNETEEEMKRKKTRKERGTRKEVNFNKQKERPTGRYNERHKVITLGQREKRAEKKNLTNQNQGERNTFLQKTKQ
jgi:hypothetical protein